MISELAGFTLSRAIPDSALMGVMTGAYKVYGGVIRDNSGQIVAHLANAANPVNIATSLFSPLDAIVSGVNSVQLSRISTDVTKLVSLAQGTMAISGLTLGVCAASFLFLNNKIKSIDSRLEKLGEDVKAIRKFLELQERARLINALKTMRSIDDEVDKGIREKLLVSSKQTFGEIHEKYRELLTNLDNIGEALAVEEYFTITVLAHALCIAELDMYKQAESELSDAYEVWGTTAERIARDFVVKDEPERFMYPCYAAHLRSDELIDWLDFSYKSDRGIEWIDDLRSTTSWLPRIRTKLDDNEKLQLEVMRKIVARDRIFKGYLNQYNYFSEIGTRPSAVQGYIESLPNENKINDCFLFLSNNILKDQHSAVPAD